tara:strand:+ start:73 stop:948 length:876 start_codon:yes stop_codon:yes gene_type:complete
MRLSFIIPVKNEENTILEILNNIPKYIEKDDEYKIFVMSDSIDRTDEIAKQAKNTRIIDCGNIGLGYSVFKGIKFAAETNPDYLFIIDGDGQTDLEDIKKFLHSAKNYKDIDIFLSSRFKEKNLIQYDYPFLNLFGTKLLKTIINYSTKYKVTDSHGGIRLFKNKVARKLMLIGDHTYVQEFLFDTSEKNFSVMELPSKWNKRNYGKSKVVGSILKYIFNVAPILFVRLNLHKKILYSLGIIVIIMAIVLAKNLSFVEHLLMIILVILLFLAGYVLESIKNIIIYLKSKNY